MFFRPNYCANCGEKIERSDWGLLTSRRFCQVCESEFKGHDLVPRVVVGAAVLFGVFGLGAYLKAGQAPVQQPVSFRQNPKPADATPRPEVRMSPTVADPRVSSSAAQAQRQSAETQSAAKLSVPRVEAEEAYICGAETKKGTPCSRRVKGNIRCYQHKGMPAMLPAEKLKLS